MKFNVNEQLGIYPQSSIYGCTECLCKDCMMWWSHRCPYGGCYDDYRSKETPYDVVHPGELRRNWANWESDQAYWCRGGVTYPTHVCSRYVNYEGSKVRECLKCNVQVFQDGYISCPIVDTVGCAACYEEFERSS